jgi:PPK2 family polyphosphate:nucleotide phosphotransferase
MHGYITLRGAIMAKDPHKHFSALAEQYRVVKGRSFRLKDSNPADTGPLRAAFKEEAKSMLARGVGQLAEAQAKLYAQDRWGVLLVFQAMDAAGKDGTIDHVMSGVNPQGVQVHSFKSPSAEELDHDFMWRCMKALPERGRIGIFNRSYYEETLVVRVHEAYLRKQKLPPELLGKKVWQHRFEDIRNIEQYLARNGYLILKFFLNVSKNEQKRRFLERLDLPEKNWKFSSSDAAERQHWGAYMAAYEDMIRNTATDFAPWYVIPADNKWFTRLAVSSAVVAEMKRLGLEFPEVDNAKKKELAQARAILMQEGSAKKEGKKK